MQCRNACSQTINYDLSFCFWVFEKKLTQKNCFLFCEKYGFFNSSIFLTINNFLLSYFPNFHGQRSGGTNFQYFIPETDLFQPVADPDGLTRFLAPGQNSQIWMKLKMDKNVIFLWGFSDSEPGQHFV